MNIEFIPTFQNRSLELATIVDPDAGQLLTIYGTPGIGKTRLLAEAASQLRRRSKQQIVCYVNFEALKELDPSHWQSHLLRALVATADSRLTYSGAEPAAAEIVAQLSALHAPPPVLMFDTTETVYDNITFLDWLQIDLVEPLITRSNVRMVLAGRTRLPWVNFRLRRAAQSVSLQNLASHAADDPAQMLVREILSMHPLQLPDAQIDELTEVVISLSSGYPGLTEHLAESIVKNSRKYWENKTVMSPSQRLVKDVVKPFIAQKWFGEIKAPWPAILWSASILPWFDGTVLRDYLTRSVPYLVPHLWDAFFIEGINHVQRQMAAVMWVEGGYRLSDTIREVVRRCWQLTAPAEYDHALDAARAVWQTLIEDPELELSDRARYQVERDAFV